MIDQTAYAKLRDLTESLHECGWSVARCEKFSADTLTIMLAVDRGADRDRKAFDAAKLLPALGANVTAERLNVSRRHVYNLVHRQRKIVHA